MRVTIAVVLIASLAFSGCVGGDDEVGKEEEPVDADGADGSKGIIVGSAVREDFSPVEGAAVSLSQDGELRQQQETDGSGRYMFEVEPGRYQVHVSAPCCRPEASSVTVKAGEEVEYPVQLQRLPPEVEVYVDKDGQWTGFVGCSIGGNLAALNEDCPDDNNDLWHEFTAGIGLRTVVVAMEWEPVVTSTTDELRHWLYVQDPEDPDSLQSKVRSNNVSAIEYRVDHSEDPVDETEHDFDVHDEAFAMAFRAAAPRSPYVDVVYQQEFTVYYHLFYGDPAPDGYSALPDS